MFLSIGHVLGASGVRIIVLGHSSHKVDDVSQDNEDYDEGQGVTAEQLI